MNRFRNRANRIKKNLSQNAGFTLVELIIVITILAILCGLSAVGILSWQDWATFKKENEYAQTLFVAAQNQLTEYVANERIEVLRKDLLKEDGVDKDGYIKYVAADGISTVDPEQIDIDGSLENLWEDKEYTDVIVSLSAQAGDYEQYLTNPQGVGVEKYWLFELLGTYVYDTSILNNGAITVEFTPEDGQVFAVIYTDKHSSFDGISLFDSGILHLRKEVDRRPEMIGYYGVDNLSKATKNVLVKDKINVHKVRLYNKETLYLTFVVDDLNSVLNNDKTSYRINLLAKDKTTNLLTIDFSGALKKESLPVNTNEIEAKVTRYDVEGIKPQNMKVLVWQEETDDTVHMVLDAADIAADAYTYSTGYDNIVYGTTDSTVPARNACADEFRTTYSFFRFGLDVQDIYAQVIVSNDDYKTSDPVDNTVAQSAKNTVFAGVKDDIYSIRNARHLYNIRYMESANSYADRNNPKTKAAGEGITFKINENINWAEFQRKEEAGKLVGYLYDSSCDSANPGKINVSDNLIGKKDEIDTIAKAVYYCDFPSIPAIRSKDTIDGNGKTITGISVSEKENEIFKAYTILDENSTKEGSIKPAGFINFNYGTVTNLTMDELTVSGENYVGGFVGVNAGNVNKLTLANTIKDKKDTSIVSGLKNVGGIIGIQLATDDSKFVNTYTAYDDLGTEVKGQEFVVLTELENNARVEGNDGIGGIVGSLRNEFSYISSSDMESLDGIATSAADYKLLITNGKFNVAVNKCENYGPVMGVKICDKCNETVTGDACSKCKKADFINHSKYIGGIAGYVYNKDADKSYRVNITDCISSPQYAEADLEQMFTNAKKDTPELEGTYVGGIAGYNYNGQINICSTPLKDGKAGYVFGDKYVGGIVGLNNGTIRGTIKNVTKNENENHVIGCDYVGGITGVNAKISSKDKDNKDITSFDPEKLNNTILIPDTEVDFTTKIEKWVNKGVVVAVNEYAGGISGYNTGWIFGCNSEITKDAATAEIEGLQSGDYVGGIAGYSNGVIGNTNRTVDLNDKSVSTRAESLGILEASSYVSGKNYVGGIVGYNDADSIIEDYKIADAEVIGDENGCFTGGYAGFNASLNLLMDTESETKEARTLLYSTTTSSGVRGGYFTGGIIGGNIINTSTCSGVSHNEVTEIVDAVDSKDDEDKEYTTPLEAVDKEDINEGYAMFSATANQYVGTRDDAVYKYVAWTDISIHNFTGKNVISWIIPLEYLEGKDFPVFIKASNYLYNAETHQITWNDTSNAFISANDKKISDSVQIWGKTKTDVEEYIKFIAGKKLPVAFFFENDNVVGTYWGYAKYPEECEFEVVKENDGERGLKLTMSVKSHTNIPLPNWRIEFEPGEGYKYDWSTYDPKLIHYSEDGKTIAIKSTNNNASVSPNGTLPGGSAIVHLSFADSTVRDAFNVDSIRLSFNNILYRGNKDDVAIMRPGSGGSSSGGSGIQEPQKVTLEDPMIVVKSIFKTDNEIKNVEGNAFVGGYAGYNLFVSSSDREAVDKIQKDIVKSFVNSDKGLFDPSKLYYSDVSGNNDNQKKLREKMIIVDNISSITSDVVYQKSNITLLMTGSSEESDAAFDIENANAIKGNLVVGGVLGYNDSNTKLYIKGIENEAKVVAEDKIIHPEEQMISAGEYKEARKNNYAGVEYVYDYSYAGGIIGKVAKETTIKNCNNKAVNVISGDVTYTTSIVTAKGTYTGGLCEINEGRIFDCAVAGYRVKDEEYKDYYGGLCGLNKETGLVEYCSFEDKTIYGKNMVGAIASENFGKISNIKFVKPKMDVTNNVETNDGVTGLYAAYNEGIIEIQHDIKDVVIKSAGKYVGAIAGINNGKIDVKKAEIIDPAIEVTRENSLTVEGSIEGYQAVGGFVGLNNNKNIENRLIYLRNKATVKATDSNAGGIAGEYIAPNEITLCYNDGLISSDEGCAGGLIGQIRGEVAVNECSNYANIASKNITGGLVGQITGTGVLFRNSNNYGDISTTNNSIGGFVGNMISTDQDLIFEECANHGNVTRDLTTSTDEVIVGGFVGSANITGEVSLEYCVNTGIVKATGSAGASGNRIGSYVGDSSAEINLVLCRNYNTFIPEDANASAGTYAAVAYCGSIDGKKEVYAENCLEATGNIRNGYTAIGVNDASRVYYVDASRFDNTDYGVYFNVQLGKSGGNFRYNGINYGDMKNNGLYLMEPSVFNKIDSANKIALTMDYTEASGGLDAVEVFFWCGDDNRVTDCKIKNATFYYSDGSNTNASWIEYGTNNGARSSYAITDESRAIIHNPRASYDKKPTRLVIEFNATGGLQNRLRGFAYVPAAAADKEAVCIYAGDGWNTAFDLTQVKFDNETLNLNEAKNSISDADIKQWNDYLIYDYYGNSEFVGYYEVRLSNLVYPSQKYMEFTFNVNTENADDMNSFVFYLAPGRILTGVDSSNYDYSGNIVFEYDNGNVSDTITFEKKGVSYGSKDSGKCVVNVPTNNGAKVSAIVLRIKEDRHDSNISEYDTDVCLRGFGFIPEGENTVHRLPTYSISAEEANIYGNSKFIPLYVDNNQSTPYLHEIVDKSGTGFYMTQAENNPLNNSFYSDDTNSYGEYLAKTTEPDSKCNRPDIYLDMDSKFVDYIGRKYGASAGQASMMSLMSFSLDEFGMDEMPEVEVLHTPNVNDLSYDDTDGIDFVFDNSVYTQYAEEYGDKVDIQMAVAVYDFEPADGNAEGVEYRPSEEQINDMSYDENVYDMWDDGAVATLYTKDNMGDDNLMILKYDGKSYTGHIDINKEYAGKWLKIALRAINTDGSIYDSYWSDEDEAGKSINYVWIHIPELEDDEAVKPAKAPLMNAPEPETGDEPGDAADEPDGLEGSQAGDDNGNSPEQGGEGNAPEEAGDDLNMPDESGPETPIEPLPDDVIPEAQDNPEQDAA